MDEEEELENGLGTSPDDDEALDLDALEVIEDDDSYDPEDRFH